MDPSLIGRYRLGNQQVASHLLCETPAQVVARLGAMQAQDYGGALWSIGLRLPGATEASVAGAIAQRTIVRTWPMRGTLHFVAAADARWMLELLTPRVLAGSKRRHEALELDETTFERCRKIFRAELQGGRILSREAMQGLLEREGISTSGQRNYHILWRLAQERLLCFGPHAGKQPTFTLFEEWLPDAPAMQRDTALAELAGRYFQSHGPASVHDFAWWSGLTMADARAGLEAVAPRLCKATLGKRDYWMPAAPPAFPAQISGDDGFLLPGFDEFLLGYTDRSAVLEAIHAPKIIPGNNGVFMPTLVRGGRVVGTWKRTLKTKALVLSAAFFEGPPAPDVFAAAARRYGQFSGLPVAFAAPPRSA